MISLQELIILFVSGSQDVFSAFQKQVQSHYQDHLLSRQPLLDVHETTSLALIDSKKFPDVNDPFYQSTIDLLKEKITHFKKPFKVADLFHFSESAQKIVILLLGIAGCGKTHLCLDIVAKWVAGTSHDQFQLVLYIPVDVYGTISVEDKSELLSTLFQFANPEAVAQVVSTGGANCLILIDGTDKIPLSMFQRSLLYKIVTGDCFKNAAVVVTGRPHMLEPLVSFSSRQLEVLPLSSGTVLEIAKKMGGDGIQGSILKRLLSDNPYIAEYCTNPAVLTGICDLFKLSTSVKTTLTTNMMNLMTLKNHSLAAVFSSQMPAEFENICQLAKEGIFSGQTSFSEPDLETLNINPEHFPENTSLICVESVPGKSKCFYFPSRITQSLLAAGHLATLNEETQAEMFVKHVKNPSLLYTWLFFAGLTKLANTSIILSALQYYIKQKNPFGQARLQLLLRCMFEAQAPSVCQYVGNLLKMEAGTALTAGLDPALLEMEVQLTGSVLQMDKVSVLDLTTIAYFVCHACIKVRLLLLDCNVTAAKLHVMAEAFQKFSIDNSSGIQELR